MPTRIKEIFCVLFGHSDIVTTSFGYVHCARCGSQIGDTLGGASSLENNVIVGHDCGKCRDNYKLLSWKDKIFCANPFTD